MRFSPQILEEIRARLPVSEVVGRSVRLKKQGREWVGLSPFNKEKTPSFYVNDQKGFYHDFSSGKHGDIFSFLMEVEGLQFTEAATRLADLAGVQLPKEGVNDAAPSRRKALLKAVEVAAAFFRDELRGSAGGKARNYLSGRGLTQATIDKFGIGYAPGSRGSLRNHLQKQGIPVPDMLEAGLLTTGENSSDPYDRFRDRVIFPIDDGQGRTIAFGGRALDPGATAKYLNSPETELFHKGALLYNQHRARAAAHRGNAILVVEGYVDAISLAQIGVDNVVAPLGTALTTEQLDLLWRLAPEPTLCFDGDGAGRRAAWRAMDLALPKLAAGRSLRFAFLPEGQDPDDLARSGGRPAMDAVLAAAEPLSEALMQRELEAGPLDTPERRAELEQRLSRLTGAIADESVRRHYRSMAQERLAEIFAPVRRNLPSVQGHGGFSGRDGRRRGDPRAAGPVRPSTGLRESAIMQSAALPPREATLIVAAINHPDLVDRYCDMFGEMDLGSKPLEALRQIVLHEVAEGTVDPAALRAVIVARGHKPLLDRVEGLVRGRREWWAEAGAAPADAETGFRHTLALHVKARALHIELIAAEAALAREPNEEHLRRIVEVQRSLRAAEGAEATIEGFGSASGRSVHAV